jgi:hypothetical protein
MSAIVEIGGHIPISGGFSIGYGTSLPQAATPTFSPVAGTYASTQTVSITCTTPSSSIYFTTDGSTPTFPITGTTTLYTGPLTVSATETIKAIGVASGFTNSAVGSATYTISSLTFNRFISAAGDDNNTGLTPATAWSITAFNTKSYSGLNIGIIGDVGATLSGFAITGPAGQFSCTSATLAVGQYVMISGTFGGSGSITGYISGTIYAISATNGSTTGTLTPMGGDMVVAAPALITTAGTPSGLTIALNQPITQGTVGGAHTTLLSILNGNANQPALNINGGTSSASTYVASCNSAGVYTPRWAVIDFAPGGVGGITSGAPAMGQSSEEATQVANPGFLTYDGLTVRNFSFAAIAFRNDGGSTITNCVIQNCEVYNGGNVNSSNNPGALKFSNHFGSIVTNCKVHGIQSTTSGGFASIWQNSALMTYGNSSGAAMNWNVTNCTLYNCPSVLAKDTFSDVNISYCYLDCGSFGSADFQGLNDGITCGLNVGAGNTSTIHHNIMLRGIGLHALDGSTAKGTVISHNNTIYGASSGGAGLAGIYMGGQTASGATIQFTHNIVFSTNGYNAGTSSASISVDLNQGWSISNTTFNNNVYGNGITFGVQNDVTLGSFAAWQTAASVDSTSIVLGSGVSPFSGTPSAQNIASFATNSNAIIGGVTCGASDGSGSIGCNF